MEKTPSERKPNRVFRGAVIRAALAEALEFGNGLLRPLEAGTECSGDYDALGVGAMDAGQLPRTPEVTNADNWDQLRFRI